MVSQSTAQHPTGVSMHVPRLARGGENAAPESSFGVYLFALRCGEGYRDMRELLVPEADDHVCPTAHSGMRGAMTEKQTEDRVVRICGHASDGVAGIDVLDACFHAAALEVFLDRVSQERAYVAVLDIPGSIALGRILHEFLARPFRHDDYRVAPPFKSTL